MEINMNIIFMGTPDFAVNSLKALSDARHNIMLVVTQPDKPKGRGHKMAPPPVKECAIELGYDVYQPETLKSDEAYEYLKKYDADLFIVVAYGQILSERVLNLPKLGCVNVHASLLPKYRGAAPIQWSIINGETKTGVTTMFMNKGLDTGDMILKKEVDIEKCDTGETLHDKLAVLGAETLIETVKLFKNNTVIREKQDDSLSCYAPMINKETAKVDFSKSADVIFNLVRGMNSYPYAITTYDNKLMKIIKCDVIEKCFTGENGEIKEVTSKGITVKCGENAILIT
ncbi:MAG: methionyl-tRNA formyltransferase, partial [Clostridia bacterium]|nr:methionyl-tRNA formyltransferase [Clostridia bacterium]